MSDYTKDPFKQYWLHQGKLQFYDELTDEMEIWEDNADDKFDDNRWQKDSYILFELVKWIDAQRAESQLQSNIWGNKMEQKS